MTIRFLLLLFLPFQLFGQIDSVPSDTVNLPFYEMMNWGIEKTEYFQYTPKFVVISFPDHSVLGTYGYPSQNDTARVDTIVLQDASKFRPDDDGTIRSICGYSGYGKHKYEYVYYDVHELQGVVITGWNYRLKYSGHWKHGKKHGKWFYYNPNGELNRTEKWRNGKLIRTRTAH